MANPIQLYNTNEIKERGGFAVILVTKADIARRWGVSRAAVRQREERNVNKNFPKPIGYVYNGNLAIYDLEDVKRYEKEENIKVVMDHPE